MPSITPEQLMAILDLCYSKAKDGLPESKTCVQLADEYLTRYPNKELAVRKMVDYQVLKCTTSGFLTGLGGLITLPVAVPANIASVLYIQLRMIATIAVMGGYDPGDDEVRTLAYVCLTGRSMADLCKTAGIPLANKLALNVGVKKIPGAVLQKINQAVGFRLATKAGSKGVINLTKMVPIAGGLVGGGIDYTVTKAIAKKAYRTFILNRLD